MLILYGPHFGVSSEGQLGKVERKGRQGVTKSCGSLLGFLAKLKTNPDYKPEFSVLDAEQFLVEQSLLARSDSFIDRPRAHKAITESMYWVIEEQVDKILDVVAFEGQIAIIGGVIVNTTQMDTDHFVPKRAEILNFENKPGERLDWFASPEIIVLGLLAGFGFYWFVVHSLTTREPFLDTGLFRDRNFTVCLALGFCTHATLYATVALLPPLLQQVLNYPALEAGFLFIPRALGSLVGMFVVARLASRLDLRWMMLAGLLLAAYGPSSFR